MVSKKASRNVQNVKAGGSPMPELTSVSQEQESDATLEQAYRDDLKDWKNVQFWKK